MRYSNPQTWGDRLFYAIDASSQWMRRVFKASPQSFIDLETATDHKTLVMTDGTLVTALRIHGTTRSALAEEVSEVLDSVTGKMSAYMNDGCHYFSIYFSRDKDGVRAELEATYGKARHSTSAMGLDFTDIIDEQIRVLENLCFKETCMLLLYTSLNGISKDEREVMVRRQKAASEGLPRANKSQPLAPFGEGLQARHDSFVEQFKNDLASARIESSILGAHDFLRFIRLAIDPEWTAPEWNARLPGDPLPLRLPEDYKGDFSSILWPALREQLVPRGATVDGTECRIGDRIYSPLTINLMPKTPEVFQALFTRLHREQIPWRIHQLCRNDGMQVLGFTETLASLLMFSQAVENKRINQVKADLEQLRESGEEIVKIQITLCTWAPAGESDLLEERYARLARCVQGWGICDVAPVEGDPLESTMCSLPGVMLGSVAEPSAAPLYDVWKMAPLTRPASPFKDGSQPLRSRDGKLMHYEPYSEKQAAWITLIFGPMGTGKSVWMNYTNLSLIMKSELKELPFISIIDVGPSSRGLVSLVRSALPKSKQHLAMYARLSNNESFAINVFDTPLGLRSPLSSQRNFLVNFLTLLVTPDSGERPIEGSRGFVSALVDLVYRRLSEFGTATIYQPMTNRSLDLILEEAGFEHRASKTTWWEVVDFLANKSRFREAGLAQRYAVPTLSTVVMGCVDESMQDMFGSNRVSETGESLPEYMYRRLTDAMNTFPILAGVTQFDLGEARIVSLDLDEVAKGSGESGKRAVGVMYMLAYQVLTQRFFFVDDHLQEIEVGEDDAFDYRPYHRRMIDQISRLPKRLCIDEKHRVSGLEAVEAQMDIAIRESRKARCDIIQASQTPGDFSKTARQLATNINILGAGTKANVQEVTEAFKLSSSMQYHLEHSMRKPGKLGATVLSISQTDEGSFEHLLYSTQGPSFLWATSTTRTDTYVRDKLAREIGDQAARRLLVARYPSGTLDDEISERKRKIGTEGFMNSPDDLANRSMDDLEAPTSLLDEIATDLLATYRRGTNGELDFGDEEDLDRFVAGQVESI